MNRPEHDRTNPQRAIDEYKKNTPPHGAYTYGGQTGGNPMGTGPATAHQATNGVPLVETGQGRTPQDLEHTVRVLTTLALASAALAAFMFFCYLAGGWQ